LAQAHFLDSVYFVVFRMAYKSAIIIAVVAALYALEYTNGSLNINATIVLVYVALRYWHEGIPVEHAWKDVMYFWRDNRQNPPSTG